VGIPKENSGYTTAWIASVVAYWCAVRKLLIQCCDRMKPHIPWRPRPLRSKKKQQKLTEAQKLVKVQLQQLRLEQKRLQVEQENFNACMAFILSLQFCGLLLCLSVGLRLFMFQSRRSNVCVRFCTFLVCSLLWLLIKTSRMGIMRHVVAVVRIAVAIISLWRHRHPISVGVGSVAEATLHAAAATCSFVSAAVGENLHIFQL